MWVFQGLSFSILNFSLWPLWTLTRFLILLCATHLSVMYVLSKYSHDKNVQNQLKKRTQSYSKRIALCLPHPPISNVKPKQSNVQKPKGHRGNLSMTNRITSWEDACICQVRSIVSYKYLLFQSHVNTSGSSLPVCPFKKGNWNLQN